MYHPCKLGPQVPYLPRSCRCRVGSLTRSEYLKKSQRAQVLMSAFFFLVVGYKKAQPQPGDMSKTSASASQHWNKRIP